MAKALNVAKHFAKALDNENYKIAKGLISNRCEYAFRDQIYCGPSKIIELYQIAGDSANNDFNSIEYESQVTPLEDDKALISFIDHFIYKTEKCTYKCQQVIEVDNLGLIIKIRHIDLPGQRQILEDFIARVEKMKSS